MNHYTLNKRYFFLSILACAGSLFAVSKNLWQPHAFSGYSSTNLIQMKDAYNTDTTNREDEHLFYLSSAGQYMQNFGCNNLGKMAFWSGSNTMTIGNNDGKADLDAYQFGMYDVNVDENGIGGSITLTPNIKQFGVDNLFYYMQSKRGHGFVAKVDMPLGAMKIQSNVCENAAIETDAVDVNWKQYPAPANRPATLTDAFQGGSASSTDFVSNTLAPIALYKGRISCCSQTAIRLADLSFTLGYNFVNEDRGFFMAGFKVSCPTGNVPTGNFMLEPIFGRAGHWGIGGEISGSCRLWETDCSTGRLWLQGEVLHLINGRTGFRSFDLKQNGPGSKYLLLQYYAAQNPAPDASPSNPTGYVASFITQAVNVTTFPVVSNFSAEGSFALMFDAQKDNWNLGIGGQVWGRTAESLAINSCAALNAGMASLNNFAVLGRQINQNDETNPVTPLSYCEPLATIKQSENVVLTADAYTTKIKDARNPQNRIPASLDDALNVCGAAEPSTVTGQVFGEFGYTWKEHCHAPNLSVFGGAEFAKQSCGNTPNLWSLGLKGSFIF